MSLTLPVGHFENFYLRLKNALGMFVPLGEGKIKVTCDDPRVEIIPHDPVLVDPDNPAVCAISGTVHMTQKPYHAKKEEPVKETPANTKPYKDWTPAEKDAYHAQARAEEMKAHWPTHVVAPEVAPITVTATYTDKNGEVSVSDTVIPGPKTSGKLFGGVAIYLPPEKLPAEAPTYKLGGVAGKSQEPPTYKLGGVPSKSASKK